MSSHHRPAAPHIEQRMLVIAEMLDHAVFEVRRVLAEIKRTDLKAAGELATGPTHETDEHGPVQQQQ